MKKIVIIILLIIGTLITMFVLYNKFLGYKSVIKENFGIDFNNIELQKLKENEEWSPNGDGTKIQIFQYETLNETLNGLNKLPIKEELTPNEIPKEFIRATKGYYKCIIDKQDNRNFNVLIIDTLNKKICVYYQIM